MAGITLNKEQTTLTLRLNKYELTQGLDREAEGIGWKRNPECLWEFCAPASRELLRQTVYGRNAILPLAIDSPLVQQWYREAEEERIE